jgi:hypothetical protein
MRLLDWRPAEGLLPRARGRAGPGVATLVARGGAGPLPRGNRGVRAPEASWRDRPIGVWLPHVAAPDPLEGPGLWRPSPSTLPSWARGGRWTYMSSGGRSGDHGLSCQVRTVHPVSQRTRVWAWKTLCPPGWTVCQMTSWRARPAERQISS